MNTRARHDKAMANRFKEFRKTYIDKSSVVTAQKLEVSQSNVSYMERGMAPITSTVIKTLERKFQLNPKWLLNGEKPVLKDKNEKTNTILDVKVLNDRIDTLATEIEILRANLTTAWDIIERQERQIDAIFKG